MAELILYVEMAHVMALRVRSRRHRRHREPEGLVD